MCPCIVMKRASPNTMIVCTFDSDAAAAAAAPLLLLLCEYQLEFWLPFDKMHSFQQDFCLTRATRFLVLQSFQQDALNCITYCKGFEIECGSTSSMAVAWSTQAAVKATPMAGTYTMTYTDCLKKIITELEVEATGTTAIDYATDATTAAGTYTDYIKRIIAELEDELTTKVEESVKEYETRNIQDYDEVDYQECNQE